MKTSLWKMNNTNVTDDSIEEHFIDNLFTFNSDYKIKK